MKKPPSYSFGEPTTYICMSRRLLFPFARGWQYFVRETGTLFSFSFQEFVPGSFSSELRVKPYGVLIRPIFSRYHRHCCVRDGQTRFTSNNPIVTIVGTRPIQYMYICIHCIQYIYIGIEVLHSFPNRILIIHRALESTV